MTNISSVLFFSISHLGLSGRMKAPRNISKANIAITRNMTGRAVFGFVITLAIATFVSEIRKMPKVIIS